MSASKPILEYIEEAIEEADDMLLAGTRVCVSIDIPGDTQPAFSAVHFVGGGSDNGESKSGKAVDMSELPTSLCGYRAEVTTQGLRLTGKRSGRERLLSMDGLRAAVAAVNAARCEKKASR